MARLISLAVLLTLIVVLGITFFRVIAPFLLPLFLAGVLTMLCQPLFRYFLDRTNGRVRLASGLTTAALVAAVLIPLVLGTLIASVQLYSFAVEVGSPLQWRELFAEGTDEREPGPLSWTVEAVNAWLPPERQTTADDLTRLISVRVREALRELGDRSLGIAGTTLDVVTGAIARIASFILGLLIFTIALYYFFADGTMLLRASEKLIPVHVEYQRQLLDQFAKVVRSVVTATFVAALTQAFATTLALWLTGFDHLLILFVLTAIASLIPLAGAWLVWGPCAVILLVQGHWLAASFLVIYGIAVVGMLDNVIRAYVLNTDTKLHPLLAFISVLGGLQVLGLWGVFIGPVVASCLHALIKIFNHELMELSRERFAHSHVETPGPAAAAGRSGAGESPRATLAEHPADEGDGRDASETPSEETQAAKPSES